MGTILAVEREIDSTSGNPSGNSPRSQRSPRLSNTSLTPLTPLELKLTVLDTPLIPLRVAVAQVLLHTHESPLLGTWQPLVRAYNSLKPLRPD